MSWSDPFLKLLGCLLVNAAVLFASYRFAGRERTPVALLHVALLWYLVQYVCVALPGLCGLLTWPVVAACAAVASASLWRAAGRSALPRENGLKLKTPAVVGLFALGFVGAFVWFNRFNPVTANDALTYHLPAAVAWIQTERICLLPVWFFNPSNTYSPLAGSLFTTWLLLPFRTDALARFVELPPLLFIGVGLYALCRELKVEPLTASLLAAAAVLSRAFLNQSLFAKDDLFVDLFFLIAIQCAISSQLTQRGGAIRLGVALGLLLATKYTSLFALPVLLLVANRAWTARRIVIVAVGVVLLAGPWYLRNWWETGNPIFPEALPLLPIHALFTSGRSEQLQSLGSIWRVVAGDQGLPNVLLIALGLAPLLLLVTRPRRSWSTPLDRVVAAGPWLGVLLFLALSPFPEVRFVQPEMLLGFVAVARCLMQVPARTRPLIGLLVLVVSVLTALSWLSRDVIELCTIQAIGMALLGAAILYGLQRWNRGCEALLATGSLLLLGYTYVYWPAYLRDCREFRLISTGPWALMYPREAPLWAFVDQNVSSTATLAYSNTYLIYPLQGARLSRRLVYAPTRPGVQTVADLPWLGSHLSGEQIVRGGNRATVAEADRRTWLTNLRASKAEFLLVMKGGVLGVPPEWDFAQSDSGHFQRVFRATGGAIYQIHW